MRKEFLPLRDYKIILNEEITSDEVSSLIRKPKNRNASR